jgi:hypothetical protein
MHEPMPTLTVRIKRQPDASASLTCTRADATTSWQRQRGGYALVFPSHDLTHFAVETTLGYAQGFYGLIADGWDIGDFAAPWPRGPIPHEALEAERRDSGAWTAAELDAHAERYVAAQRALHPGRAIGEPPHLTDAQIERVRGARDELLRKWSEVTPGGALELRFVR